MLMSRETGLTSEDNLFINVRFSLLAVFNLSKSLNDYEIACAWQGLCVSHTIKLPSRSGEKKVIEHE